MSYEPIHWVKDETPLSAANFNHMEEGIIAANDRQVYKHVAKLIGKSADEEYDVYLDFVIYDNSDEAYNHDSIMNVFETQFEVRGIVKKDDAYLRIDVLGIQNDALYVLFGDSEYGFSIGDYDVEDNVIHLL